jgi:hypothetical protein
MLHPRRYNLISNKDISAIARHSIEIGYRIISEEITVLTRVKSVQRPPSEGGH